MEREKRGQGASVTSCPQAKIPYALLAAKGVILAHSN